MTLLEDIRDSATDSRIDISTVLRKAKILAARLKNPELQNWVDRELNGYAHADDLPPYRILPAHVEGHLVQGFTHWNHAPIMTSFLPEKLRDWGEKTYLFPPISSIVEGADGASGDGFQIPWPQEMAVKYGAKGYNSGVQCLGAWQIVTRAALKGVVDTVRNRLLDFALKIEMENPGAGEAPPSSEPVPPEKVRQMVMNIFYAPVGNIAQNSESFTQSSSMGIRPEEISRLVKDLSEHLAELNLGALHEQRAEAQIAALKAELVGQPDPGMVTQAGRTLRNITEGAIGSLLAAGVQPSLWNWIQQTLARF
jgi:hypothetical protein